MNRKKNGNQTIRVGTSGYGRYPAPEGWKDTYESKLAAFADHYRSVELNRTFYKLPMVKTAKRWRKEAGENFEFFLKAWQALTHETSSPTWRKNVREDLTDEQREYFGMLRPHRVNVSAWERTKAIADALDASICVVQTPPGFGVSEEHRENMYAFFDRIDRGSLEIAWEPRGDWLEQPEQVREVVDELELIHVVDVLREDPVSSHPVSYVRLHGLNEKRYDYRYDYSSDELEKLAVKLRSLAREKNRVCCMFNNDEMYDNADQLRRIIDQSGSA